MVARPEGRWARWIIALDLTAGVVGPGTWTEACADWLAGEGLILSLVRGQTEPDPQGPAARWPWVSGQQQGSLRRWRYPGDDSACRWSACACHALLELRIAPSD
jgi:hypothetical protein